MRSARHQPCRLGNQFPVVRVGLAQHDVIGAMVGDDVADAMDGLRPDLVVKEGDQHIIGYIEAKDIGRSLDEAERSEQLERYLKSLENLILTDYLEFRWYHRGELRESARLARLTRDGKIVSEKKGEAEVAQLFESFFDQTPTPITSSKELSERLARLAHLIRDAVIRAFELEADSASSPASPHLRNLRQLAQSIGHLPGPLGRVTGSSGFPPSP